VFKAVLVEPVAPVQHRLLLVRLLQEQEVVAVACIALAPEARVDQAVVVLVVLEALMEIQVVPTQVVVVVVLALVLAVETLLEVTAALALSLSKCLTT
jgi:hypothetical protein